MAAAWTEERHLAGDTPPLARAWPMMPGALPPIAGGGFDGVVPTVPHRMHPVGRDLSAYRVAPVLFATRTPAMIRRE